MRVSSSVTTMMTKIESGFETSQSAALAVAVEPVQS